ncbi:MAG: hypothetical protein K2Y09_07885 [Nitrosomonas sp.]|uniref:hypothetical protein n=1 Tax=Nitrosomonas sp. TaxID=42353 RepID=UPI001D7312FF|nr:hypothetical protein [Nitrosomonas sp.]MBX9895083.1 hypothetical protein [Nitrosomonas sp.]
MNRHTQPFPFNRLRFTSFTMLLLLVSWVLSAQADTIELLQKNASIAYEKMMEARKSADALAKDAALAERKLATAKQKLAEAEQEAEAAKTRSERARMAAQQAANQWKQATDALASEWGNSEVK